PRQGEGDPENPASRQSALVSLPERNPPPWKAADGGISAWAAPDGKYVYPFVPPPPAATGCYPLPLTSPPGVRHDRARRRAARICERDGSCRRGGIFCSRRPSGRPR